MPHISIVDPVPGDPDSTEEPKIPTDLNAIVAAINGNLGGSNLLPSLVQTMLFSIVGAGSGDSFAWNSGVATLTGPLDGATYGSNAPYSTALPVAHGLGVTPVFVLTQSLSVDMTCAVTASDPTDFTVQGKQLPNGNSNSVGTWGSAGSTSQQFAWMAFGIKASPSS